MKVENFTAVVGEALGFTDVDDAVMEEFFKPLQEDQMFQKEPSGKIYLRRSATGQRAVVQQRLSAIHADTYLDSLAEKVEAFEENVRRNLIVNKFYSHPGFTVEQATTMAQEALFESYVGDVITSYHMEGTQ
jgi:hypothetical protein